MLETIETSPSSPPPRRWRISPPRFNWRPRLRWFAAEFLVVVSGVLVALALNAWWVERQDRQAERFYIDQLLSDARKNERILQSALMEDRFSLEALVGLTASLQADELPGASIAEDMGVALRYSDPRPVLGTLDHLVGSGRLELLQSDSLRFILIDYASLMHSDMSEQSRHINLLSSNMHVWFSRQQRAGVGCAMFTEDSVPSRSMCDEEFRTAWPMLRRDPDYRAAVLGVRAATWNRIFYIDRMLRDTRRLRGILEREAAD